MSETRLVHGTAVAIDGAALLLRGASGAGKSDLALRLIDAGASLVADDQALIRRVGTRVMISAPETIRGLIEIRGIGILRIAAVEEAELCILVNLVGAQAIERLPEPAAEEFLGCRIPLIALASFESSAAAKLKLALRAFASPARVAIIS